jgi:hypothetical protein
MDVDGVYSGDELGLPYRDLIGEGVVGVGDLLVAQRAAGANMSVDVAAGACWIKGDTDGLRQPTYRCLNDGVVNLAIAAADATNPRIDRVIAEIIDATFAGASRLWRLRVITGTPAGSPAAPAQPASAITLATISVPALDTSIQTAQITDARVRAQVGAGAALGGVDLSGNLDFVGGTSRVYFNALNASAYPLAFKRSTDAVEHRFAIREDGLIEWGTGAATRDVNLYRGGADQLKTDDSFNVGGTRLYLSGVDMQVHAQDVAAATGWLRAMDAGNANWKYILYGDGKQEWGDGTAVPDTNLYRSGANVLRTDDQFRAVGLSVGSFGTAGEASLGATGPSSTPGIAFGSAWDTVIYRSTTARLKTDQVFYARGAFAHVRRTTNLALSAGVLTKVVFDQEVTDTDAFWTSGAADRLTFAVAGVYRVSVTWGYGSGASGDILTTYIDFRNAAGTLYDQRYVSHAAGWSDPGQTIAVERDVAAGDYCEIVIRNSVARTVPFDRLNVTVSRVN